MTETAGDASKIYYSTYSRANFAFNAGRPRLPAQQLDLIS